MNRVFNHLSKHVWFYAKTVRLLGTIGVKLLMGDVVAVGIKGKQLLSIIMRDVILLYEDKDLNKD